MKFMKKIRTISWLLEDVSSIKGFITWPKFSATSYIMVSGLARQGILPKTVLDVGANVGQFAVAAAKMFPHVRIHSFEPVPECVVKLRRNISKLSNIRVYPIALGDSEGETTFHVNSYILSSSILPLAKGHREAFPNAQQVETITVQVSTLDSVFDGVDFQPPVLLKLDVQGYEGQTLRGGVDTLKRVDYVVLEASFKPMYEGEILFMDIVRMMEKQGFRFERPVGWCQASRSNEILQMDALFMRNT